MENEPIRDPRLWEAMEACRPGRDDLADPEMAELARLVAASPELASLHERLQRFDAALADAFHDVPVPEGLESRILARLEAESAARRAPSPELVVAGHDEDLCGRSDSRGPRTARRRWLIAVGGLTAAAAAVLILAFGLLQQTGTITKADLLAGAIECFVNEMPEEGQPRDPAISPSRYPLSPTLIGLVSGRVSTIRWRPLDGFLSRSADAFDLIGPEGRVATVYVASCSVNGLPAEVPLRPMLSTGETSASAWQEGELVYVVVVGGGERAYERLFAAGAGPLA